MSVRAIRPDYDFDARDLQKHYGDNILVYVGWDHHTFILFCTRHVGFAAANLSGIFGSANASGFHINILTLKTLNGMKCNLL